MTPEFTERARAKINLSLRVLGRRADGYHELRSLVAFADVGDVVTLIHGAADVVRVEGPFAAAIDGENLLQRVVDLVRAQGLGIHIGTIVLDKRLPVAAGLGGGSADAAALMRAIMRAEPEAAAHIAWPQLARAIGADVPVCLLDRAALMWGVGEHTSVVDDLPRVPVVLVNPGVPLATGPVFARLGAGPAPERIEQPQQPVFRDGLAGVLRHMHTEPNDLETPARALCPEIGEVLAALADCPGVRIARMSGSGPTCFALFDGMAAAEHAAARLRGEHSGWWVVASTIG